MRFPEPDITKQDVYGVSTGIQPLVTKQGLVEDENILKFIPCLLLFSLTAAPGTAIAHASLIESHPSDGEVLPVSPGELTLDFNEPVGLIQFKVIDANGVEAGKPAAVRTDGSRLTLPLTETLADGTYVLSYRVVSSDTHPVAGAYAFSVGAAGAVPKGVAQAPESNDWNYAVGANRWALYTLMLIATGSALFILLIRAPGEVILAATKLGAASAMVAVASYVFAIALGGSEMLTGGASILLHSAAWKMGWQSTLGSSAMIGIPGMLLIAVGLRRKSHGTLVIGVIVALGSFLVTGHAATADPVWLMTTVVAIHLACAAFWLGSLYPLFRATRLADTADASSVVTQFSRWAVRSVAALIASGCVISWVQLGRWNAFIDTSYGWRLILKLGLFVILLALAGFNKRVLTPALVSGTAGVRQRLRRTINLEFILYVLILGAAASLTLTPPPRALTADNAGLATNSEFMGVAHSRGYEMMAMVSPARAGENLIVVSVSDDQSRPVALESMTISLSLPAADVSDIRKSGKAVGTDWHFNTNEMIVPGEWELEISAFIDAYDKVDFEISVPIN